MHAGKIPLALLCTARLLVPDMLASQGGAPVTDSNTRVVAYETHLAMERASPFGKLTWQFLGPTNMSGRANAVAVADRGGRRRIYVGYSGSGLWKSDDNGATWQTVFTRAASTAIRAVAVAPSNPDIVWLLTGTTRSHIPLASVGVYKSTDAGLTWHHRGLADIGQGSFGRIVIHPTKPDIVYVAASGGPDPKRNIRGVFKTTDGGKTWAQAFTQTADVGANDLVMDPRDPQTLYVSTRLRVRGNEPPVLASVPPEARPSIFKTKDGGQTWSEIAAGLPAAASRGGAFALDISRSRPNVLYALVQNQLNLPAIYRSDDSGATWRKTSRSDDAVLVPQNPNNHWTQGIRVDPKDEQTIYTFGSTLKISHDGGKTFQHWVRQGGLVHLDHNDLWIDPVHLDVIYDCNDGGFLMKAGDASFTLAPTPTAQLYNVELDNATPFHVFGSVQDESSMRGAVDLAGGRDTVKAAPFDRAPGGEVTSHAVDPGNPNILYSATAYNAIRIFRADLAMFSPGRQGGPPPPPRADEPPLRGPWMAAIALSPHDAKTVYFGVQWLYRSRDQGNSWERISPDLSGGGPANMRRPDYVNQAISTLAESPIAKGLIYAGTDDGHLHVTKDGGGTWIELTAYLPHKAFVTRVVASSSAAGTVYVMEHGRDDDFAPYLYRSTDYGETWTNLAANIPAGPVNVLREDPDHPNILYAGTDFGVYISTNGGARWEVLGGNLPSVCVTDLQIHPRDQMVVISTFGRGVWVMDALTIRPR